MFVRKFLFSCIYLYILFSLYLCAISTHRVYKKINTCDNLTSVNFRMHDIVVCPFSTIFTTINGLVAADRFENPDDKFRVVRNLYIIVSL